MKIIDKKYIQSNKNFILEEIKKGKIFVYPTDTIYGLGTNATNSLSILKIRNIKQSSKPFSVIAPSKYWIKENCILNKNSEKWLNKLPGPYTLILNLKNKNVISKETNLDQDTLGVRQPDNWFFELVKEVNIPFITTSVNITGDLYLTDISKIEEEIKNQVDYIIDDKVLNGNPSTIVNLTKAKEEIIKR